MSIVPIDLAGTAFSLDRAPSNDRTELREAAQQFEAILLRQMLASARNTDFGGDDLFGGGSDNTFKEMRDSQFADLAAQSGQIGFADAIEAQLARFLPHGDG